MEAGLGIYFDRCREKAWVVFRAFLGFVWGVRRRMNGH